MPSARHPLVRRLAPVLPTFALTVAATVGVIAAGPSDEAGSSTRVQTVSYANGSPIGKVEHFALVKGGLRASGWTFDPTSVRSLRVYPKVSGVRGTSVLASRKRLDVKRKYHLSSSRHGFSFFIPVPQGRRTVCLYAKDIGRGKDKRLGCKYNVLFYYGPNTAPAPQKTPAPVSTSRYVRNIRGNCDTETATMSAAGKFDAQHNPSNHRYLQLLDIGGQTQSRDGVMLSATTRFVTYAALLSCMKSYVAGYVSGMLPRAPATIAVGVNNDIDVNATTGRDWATKVINPLASYAAGFTNIQIAGANDIEPGFSGSYSASSNWVAGYLAATRTRFVFNGSADGCAWTVTNRSCNNGWTMAGLYNLAAGMAPTRTVNLPQVYNYTMADQWKYISLTGVGRAKPRINFGGPLTEVTACAQARGGCASITGHSAWQRLWNNLQSHPSLRVSSLPYSTDLRIDS